MPEITFSEGIKQATEYLLRTDESVVILGLGADYKGKGLDGTVGDLAQEFPDRVLDTPLSEGGVGDACVGMAINNLKVCYSHSRVEFLLFAADAVLNQASKWHNMLGGEGGGVPIVFRAAIGRGLGGGSQHSQALFPLWANCTGLKVVCPSTPKQARNLLYSSMLDPNPVVFLESRWLYNVKQNVDEEIKQVPLNKAEIICEGSDLTLVSYGEGIYEALLARQILAKYGISIEIVSLCSLNPIDHETVQKSVAKTKRILGLEMTNDPCSPISDVFGKLFLNRELSNFVKWAELLSCPHVPVPAAPKLTEIYYPTKKTVINTVLPQFGFDKIDLDISYSEYHHAPKTNLSDLLV